MKKATLNKIIIILVCLFIITLVISLILCFKAEDRNKTILGLWWWDNRLDNSYLDYAYKNNVTEIYYYTSSFTEKTSGFIKEANDKGIKVFWLTGDYQWIENNTLLENKLSEFIQFQNNYEFNFSGIHFDIEPHQAPDFEENKNDYLTKFVKLTYNLKKSYPNIWIEYDIPFWLDNEITFNNITKPTYEFIIDNSNRVTIMSYRDTYKEIYDSAKEEIEYAKSVNKAINLGIETQENNYGYITFFEEGKKYMYEELKKLREIIPSTTGIAIHHIKSWYLLKE